MSPTATRHRFRLLAATLCVAVLPAAACSDAGSDASATMQSGNRPTGATELPPTTADSEGDPTPPPTTAPSTAPSPEPSGDTEAFCTSLEEFVRTGGANDGVEALLGWFEEWRELGPPELHDELDVLTGMVEALDGLDGQDPSSLGRLLEALLDPEVVKAIDTIASYAADECGVDLEGGGLGNLDDLFGGSAEG